MSEEQQDDWKLDDGHIVRFVTLEPYGFRLLGRDEVVRLIDKYTSKPAIVPQEGQQ